MAWGMTSGASSSGDAAQADHKSGDMMILGQVVRDAQAKSVMVEVSPANEASKAALDNPMVDDVQKEKKHFENRIRVMQLWHTLVMAIAENDVATLDRSLPVLEKLHISKRVLMEIGVGSSLTLGAY